MIDKAKITTALRACVHGVVICLALWAIIVLFVWFMNHATDAEPDSLVGVVQMQVHWATSLKIMPPPKDKTKKRIIDEKYWVCTSTHIWHHPASPGTLTRFGRVGSHGEYDTLECDQWSAIMTDGTLGGGATKAENFYR